MLEFIVLLFVQELLTQKLALFGTWIFPNGGNAFTRRCILFRQVEMLPAAKVQDVPSQVLVTQALTNNNHAALFLVIQTALPGATEPIPRRVRLCLTGHAVVGVIDNQAGGALTGTRTAYSSCLSVTALIILEVGLQILIAGHAEHIPKEGLVPFRLDEHPAIAVIANGQIHRVRRTQEALVGIARPYPGREGDGEDGGLGMGGRDIDHEAMEQAIANRLQVLAAGVDVHTWDKRARRFDGRPGVFEEVGKRFLAPPSFFAAYFGNIQHGRFASRLSCYHAPSSPRQPATIALTRRARH